MGQKSTLIAKVHDSVRKHQSVGRAFLYSIVGELDVETRAEGAWVHGASGRKYLDWGGYSVFLLGHSHPKIVAAVVAQLGRLPGSSRAFPNEAMAAFHCEVTEVAPNHISKFMLLNSGAEAVEAAIKLARLRTGRDLVCYLEKAYHGKTVGALSITDAERFRTSIRTLDTATMRISRTDMAAAAQAIERLRPAAVFLEAIQGEGGIFELEPPFMTALADACRRAGSLIVCDEIQCGLGRSGRMWAFSAADISPDIVLIGKALGGGVMPVSALAASESAYQPYDRDPLVHSSTFGGNPLAAAAAAATLRAIRKQDIAAACAAIGDDIMPMIEALCVEFPRLLRGVSGRGLLRGLHFTAPDKAAVFLQKCFQHGLLLTPCLTTPNVLRLSPPAITTPDEIAAAGEALACSARDTMHEYQ